MVEVESRSSGVMLRNIPLIQRKGGRMNEPLAFWALRWKTAGVSLIVEPSTKIDHLKGIWRRVNILWGNRNESRSGNVLLKGAALENFDSSVVVHKDSLANVQCPPTGATEKEVEK